MPVYSASTVLLISRGTMSGATMIGECLSRTEGVRCVVREDLLATVNSYGNFATRIAAQIAKAEQAYDEFSEIRRPYQVLMRRALLEHARQGRLVYFGYSGHLLLPRISHFVRIRLIAPMKMRIQRTRETLGYTEPEARDYIRRVDQERAHWARMMYGVDIGDPARYDMCLNVERLSLSGACDLLRKVNEQDDFQPTPQSIAEVENEYLATQALAALVMDPATQCLEIGASASGGNLHLVGPHLSESDKRVVLSVAGSVPGVQEVDYEPGYSPAFRYAS
jgi:cytidylate kinase